MLFRPLGEPNLAGHRLASSALVRPAIRVRVFAFLLGLFFVSCTVGPNHRRPDLPLADDWHAAVKLDAHASPGQMSVEQWWGGFTDSTLKGLIAQVRADNPTLKRALYRIDEAWAQRRVLAGGTLPHADFTGRADRGLGEFDREGIRWEDTQSRGEYGSIDVGWEIDLFGGRRRMIEASTAQHERSIEGWRDSLVFLTGEVALRYIDLRAAEAELALRRETVESYRKIHALVAGREEEGLGSKIAVREALARLRAEEAKLPSLEKDQQVARNQIARLCGTFPGNLGTRLTRSAPIPKPPRSVDAKVPAELLRSRPDLRAAERAVARESAELGVAISELYPKFSLSGALTYELLISGGTTEIFRRTLGGGVGLAQRLFHGGADQARIAEQRALLQQEIAGYEETVLRALTEVEDALTGMHFGRNAEKRLAAAEAASKGAVRSLHEAFADGLIDLRDLLRAEQELAEIRLEAIFARSSLARESVRLFKALGGGELPKPPPADTKKIRRNAVERATSGTWGKSYEGRALRSSPSRRGLLR